MLGGILVLKPALDFGLPNDIANGVSTNNQLQMTLNLTNQSTNNYAGITVYVMTLSEGVLTINHSDINTQIGTISKQDVLHSHSHQSHYIDFNDLELIDSSYQGGNLKSTFKHKILPFLGKVAKGVFEDVLVPYGKKKLKERLGVGEGEDGGFSVGGDGLGVGGRKMSRHHLKKRIVHF